MHPVLQTVLRLEALEERLAPTSNPLPYSSTEVLVQIDTARLDDLAAALTPALAAAIDLSASRVLFVDQGQAVVEVSLNASSDPRAVLDGLRTLTVVNWASPNFLYQVAQDADPVPFAPDDPRYGEQYHHPLMKNDLAWTITQGAGVIVAIMDSGVTVGHEDLYRNIWINQGEIPAAVVAALTDVDLDGVITFFDLNQAANQGAGKITDLNGNGRIDADDLRFTLAAGGWADDLDNDGNDYDDDLVGWDFVTDDNNPNPVSNSGSTNTHGTHVAGIVGATFDNATGVTGTAGLATIMPIRWAGSDGGFSTSIIVNSLHYAVDNGAKIINISYSTDDFLNDPALVAALDYAYNAGTLIVNSAGNDNAANPARQGLTQMVQVASTDSSDVRSSFSNYGIGIDVAAPGSSILSTVPTGYDTLSGTSMAAPNVAAVAALLWAHHPGWSRDQVVAALLGTVDNIDAQNPALVGQLGAGRVNAYAALTGTLAPPRIGNITGLPAAGGTTSTPFNTFRVFLPDVLDPATVNDAAAFELRGAGADDTFGTGDDVLLPLTVTNGPYRIGTNWLDFSMAYLTPGDYRFTIKGDVIADPFGTDLDGDGNGSAGGDLVRDFSVAYQLHGRVYHDVSADDARDAGEPSLAGWLVWADADNDGEYDSGAEASTQSLANGFYAFSGLAAGTHTIRAEIKSGWRATGPNSYSISLASPSDSAGERDIGRKRLPPTIGAITGLPAEGGTRTSLFDNFTVALPDELDPATVNAGSFALVGAGGDDTFGTDDDFVVSLTSTDGPYAPGQASLNFSFGSPLASGFYQFRVHASVQDPFGSALDGNGDGTGGDDFVRNFGVFDQISGHVFHDWNNNGTRDANDPGLSGWRVFVDADDNGDFDAGTEVSFVTDASGAYVFSGLSAGGQRVRVEIQAGWQASSGTQLVNLPSVDFESSGHDLGVRQTNAIYGQQFWDINGDSVKQASEAGLAGFTVYLDENGNGQFDRGQQTVASTSVPVAVAVGTTESTTINVSGLAGRITDLDVGVSITVPNALFVGLTLVSPSGTSVQIKNIGGVSGADMTGTILDDEGGDVVTNGPAPFSGRRKPNNPLSAFDGEDPNGTWTLQVRVFNSASASAATLTDWRLDFSVAEPSQTTDALGNYVFANRPAGTHTVRQDDQPGWQRTAPAGGAYSVILTAGQSAFNQDFGVAHLADLQITKTDGLNDALPGQTITYTITVTNAGPSSVTGAHIVDSLPAALSNVSYTSRVLAGTVAGQSGATDPVPGSIDELVDLSAGAVLEYTVTATIVGNGSGPLTNTATVTPPDDVTDTDRDNNSATDLTDVNAPPVVSAQSFSIAEFSPAGSTVGTVAASDPDAGQTLTYALIAGDPAGIFAIDGATGEITVANGALLDIDLNPTFVLTVQVADNGVPQRSATAFVTIQVVNSADHFETSTWVDYSTNTGWSPQLVGDFNGDGRDDVANFLASNGGWYVSLSTGTSFLQPLRWIDLANSGFAQHLVGDFNGDGRDDIASFYSPNGVWYVSISTGLNSFTNRSWVDLASSGWSTQQVGDFNGDGKDDIAGLYSDGRWYVSISNGTSFTNRSWNTVGTGWTRLVVGDFNGDGRDDVAGFKSSTGKWYVSLSSGTSFGPSTVWDTIAASWANQVVGDFNGDGMDDIAGLYASDGRWYVSESSGTNFTTVGWGASVGATGWTRHVVADFSGDGIADIAGFKNGDGSWWTSVSDTTTFTTALWSNGVDWGWSSPVTGNFNGDPFADVAAFRTATGAWHVGLGLPSSLLRLADTALSPAADAGRLTQAQLDTMVARAFSIFAGLGVNTKPLSGLSFVIADLAGNVLGQAGDKRISIDLDAAGHGWALGDAVAADDVDLLSVVLHELGHEFGLEHGDAAFMAEAIGLGERRLPTSAELDDFLMG